MAFANQCIEKKSITAKTEKEQMEAKSSAKVLCVVGLSQAIMFGIMHCFILYSSWIQANTGSSQATIDIAKSFLYFMWHSCLLY